MSYQTKIQNKHLLRIAIVGAEEKKWRSEEQKVRAKNVIKTVLARHAFTETINELNVADTSMEPDYSTIVLVTGGCPRGGVDKWSIEIAKELGIDTIIYPPEVYQWHNERCDVCMGNGSVPGEGGTLYPCPSCKGKGYLRGYRERNMLIAENCDVLYDIEPAYSCKYCHGQGCSKCEGDGAYSGGTWTYKYARKLGKEVHKVVI